MKYYLTFIFIAMFLVNTASSIKENKLIIIDGYAAKINDVVITRSEVRNEMKPYIKETYNLYKNEELEIKLNEIFDKTLQKMIDRELIYISFKNQEGKIPDSMLEDEINNIIRTKYQNNRVTFHKSLINKNQTYENFKQEIEKNIAIAALVSQNIGAKIQISPKSIKNYYTNNIQDYYNPEKVKYSILKTIPSESIEELNSDEILILSIYEKLKNGKSYNEVKEDLKNESEKIIIKSYPWMLKKDIPEYLIQEIKNLRINEYSSLIKLEDSFVIVYLEDKIKSSYIPFESIKSEIKIKLTNIKREREYNNWLDQLKNTNYIKIYK